MYVCIVQIFQVISQPMFTTHGYDKSCVAESAGLESYGLAPVNFAMESKLYTSVLYTSTLCKEK